MIGEGTLLTGNSVGGEGDASFSGSLCNTGGPSSSSFIPASVSVMFNDAVAAFPLDGFIFLTELLLFFPLPPDFPPTTLPPTTDTVTSFSTAVPPGSVSSAPGSSIWSSDSYLKSSLVSPRDDFPGSDLAESSPDLDGSAGGIGLNLGDRGIYVVCLVGDGLCLTASSIGVKMGSAPDGGFGSDLTVGFGVAGFSGSD